MSTKILGPVGLTVDELIQALRNAPDAGHGQTPVHALMGDHTGPVRAVDVVPSRDFNVATMVLVIADDDPNAGGAVLRERGALINHRVATA